jgi:hypothetical protein
VYERLGRKWSGLVAERERRGQSEVAFSRERCLCTSYFFYWKKRLSLGETGQYLEYRFYLPAS